MSLFVDNIINYAFGLKKDAIIWLPAPAACSFFLWPAFEFKEPMDISDGEALLELTRKRMRRESYFGPGWAEALASTELFAPVAFSISLPRYLMRLRVCPDTSREERRDLLGWHAIRRLNHYAMRKGGDVGLPQILRWNASPPGLEPASFSSSSFHPLFVNKLNACLINQPSAHAAYSTNALRVDAAILCGPVQPNTSLSTCCVMMQRSCAAPCSQTPAPAHAACGVIVYSSVLVRPRASAHAACGCSVFVRREVLGLGGTQVPMVQTTVLFEASRYTPPGVGMLDPA